jgi:hypothetical protein
LSAKGERVKDEVKDGMKGVGIVLLLIVSLAVGLVVGFWKLLVVIGRTDWTKGGEGR